MIQKMSSVKPKKKIQGRGKADRSGSRDKCSCSCTCYCGEQPKSSLTTSTKKQTNEAMKTI
jgi:hypothetical protein